MDGSGFLWFGFFEGLLVIVWVFPRSHLFLDYIPEAYLEVDSFVLLVGRCSFDAFCMTWWFLVVHPLSSSSKIYFTCGSRTLSKIYFNEVINLLRVGLGPYASYIEVEIYSMILVVEVTYVEGKDSWDGISDSAGVWMFDFPNTCFFYLSYPYLY